MQDPPKGIQDYLFIDICLMIQHPRPILLIPAAAGIAATLLFVAQGGFGGGHGTWDSVIGFLMLPSILAMALTPLPDWLFAHDYLFFVAIPTVANTALLWLFLRLRRM